MVPNWIWIVFTFVFGCCAGSFLNVVIYRLPLDKSLVSPPSSCPACGHRIHFYDNIPLVSYIVLRGKCRHCKVKISPRYLVVELLTGLVFGGLFAIYFRTNLRAGIGTFTNGGWFLYLTTIILLSAMIAASAIDLELRVIPLSICWFITATGITASTFSVFIIDPNTSQQFTLLPRASATTGALTVGAVIGTVISLALTKMGLIKRSYAPNEHTQNQSTGAPQDKGRHGSREPHFNDRLEICKEIIFILPIIVCSLSAFHLTKKVICVNNWWSNFTQHPIPCGLLGSIWGYLVGCGVVWTTRILGTLGFGREAMGLGDVHLMGAAGTLIGPLFVVVAFFVAPFFGLSWAASQMFFKKIRQIPYGPFLSSGVLTVIILHDHILEYLGLLGYR